MRRYFWTMTQEGEIREYCMKHNLPEQVEEEIFHIVQILDSNYGIGRDMEADGGFIALLICDKKADSTETYDAILKKYSIDRECCEFHDTLCANATGTYYSDLYIVNSEYAVAIIWLDTGRS